MELSLSQEFWCLYNSPFLKVFIGFVTFGSIPFIVPKLFSDFDEKRSIKPRIHLQYNKAVKRIKFIGIFIIICSTFTIILYLTIWLSVDGKIKCEELVNINPYLIGFLYFFSILDIFSIGFFYHYWKILEKGNV